MRKLELEAIGWLGDIAEQTGAFAVSRRRHSPSAPDAILQLDPTNGSPSIRVQVEARSRVTPRDLLGVLDHRHRSMRPELPILCSPTISERVAALCQANNVGYVDGSRNCHIALPGLFIHIEGRSSTHRSRRKAANLFAPKSSRIARILLSHIARHWQIQELAREATVSLGLTSRIAQRLVEEAFAEFQNGKLVLRDPENLLEAWRQSYRLPVQYFFYVMADAKDIETRISEWAAESGTRCALTAFSGAWRLAPMVRQNLTAVYVDLHSATELNPLIAHLDAKSVETGANLSVWLPPDESVFYRMQVVGGLPLVSALQMYLDLAQFRGRGEEAAREVFDKELRPSWQPQMNTPMKLLPPASR